MKKKRKKVNKMSNKELIKETLNKLEEITDVFLQNYYFDSEDGRFKSPEIEVLKELMDESIYKYLKKQDMIMKEKLCKKMFKGKKELIQWMGRPNFLNDKGKYLIEMYSRAYIYDGKEGMRIMEEMMDEDEIRKAKKVAKELERILNMNIK